MRLIHRPIPILLTWAILLAACSPSPSELDKTMPDIAVNSIEFLQLLPNKPGEEIVDMQAQLKGELVVSDSCISIVNEHQIAYTPIWPASYSLHSEGNLIVVKNRAEVIGREGEGITITGGQLENIDHLNMESPQSCQSDRYWLVANQQ